MLGADLTVWVQKIKGKDGATGVLVKSAESLTGIIVDASLAYPTFENIENSAQEVAHNLALRIRLGKVAAPTLAVGAFENRSRFERLRPLETGLPELINHHLQQRGDLRITERTDLKPLLQELDLIESGLVDEKTLPDTLPTRAATYLLTGTFQEKAGGKELQVAIEAQLVHAQTGQAIWSKHYEDAAGKFDQIASALSADAHHALTKSATDPHPATVPSTGEAELLLAMARQDIAPLRLGYNEALGMLIPDAPGWASLQDCDLAYAAIARKAANRLECVLFIAPANNNAKIMLASIRSIDIKGIWDFDQAERLFKEVIASDNGSLAIFARRRLSPLYGAAYRLDPNPRYIQLSADFAAQLQDAPEDPDHFQGWIDANCGAAWGYRQLKRYDLALEMLKRNVTRVPGLPLPAQRNCTEALAATTNGLAQLAQADPTKVSTVTQLLDQWRADPSAFLHYLAAMARGQIAQQEKDYATAAAMYHDAVKVCAGQKDNWFPPREGLALAPWLTMQSQAESPAAALQSAQPFLARVPDYSKTRPDVVLALGDIYEKTGQPQLAEQLYRAYRATNGTWSQEVLTRLARFPAPATQPAHESRLMVDVFEPHWPIQKVVVSNGKLWAEGVGGVSYFDENTKKLKSCRMSLGYISSLAAGNDFLWVGTNGQGLWRLDLAKKPADPDAWKHWTTKEGLPDDRVSAVYADGRDLWFGSGLEGRGGLVRLDDTGAFHTYEQADAPTIPPTAIAATPEAIWTASPAGTFAMQRQSSTWKKLSENNVARFYHGNGRILAVMERKLMSMDLAPKDARYLWQEVPTAKLPTRFGISTIAEAEDRLWIAGAYFPADDQPALCALPKDAKQDTVQFDSADGLHFARVNDGVLVGPTLWLATDAGLVAVRPAAPTTAPATLPSKPPPQPPGAP